MEEINIKNREIAIMMGFQEYKLERNGFWGKKRMTYTYGEVDKTKYNWLKISYYIGYFQYNCDWNWLMNVIISIERDLPHYQVNINGTYCEIININDPNETFVSNETTKIDSVFNVVYKFACNYNKKDEK
jgi:hypothetical protein